MLFFEILIVPPHLWLFWREWAGDSPSEVRVPQHSCKPYRHRALPPSQNNLVEVSNRGVRLEGEGKINGNARQ